MNESKLQEQLIHALRSGLPGSIVIKHTEKITYGVPDLSISWLGKTSWLEIKFANPLFKITGVQTRIIKCLGQVTLCHYVIYAARDEYGTFIVHPSQLNEWEQTPFLQPGFDHGFVADFVRRLHGGRA
jgi:hypothetical protein